MVPSQPTAGPGGRDEFLDTVRAMVHGAEGATPVPRERIVSEEPSSRRERSEARRADRQARRSEDKLARAERRNAKKRRDPASAPARVVEAPVEAPVETPVETPVEDAGRQRVPAQADVNRSAEPAVAVESTEVTGSRRERRRERRQAAARAIAETVPADDDPAPVEPALAPGESPDGATAVLTSRPTRRSRRRAAVEAVAGDVGTDVPEAARDDVAGPTGSSTAETVGKAPGDGRRPKRSRDERAFSRTIAKAVARGESGDGRVEHETLAEYVARVDAAALPRRSRRQRPRTPLWWRRTVRVTLVVLVLGACVALPWAAPSVPRAITDLWPGGSGSPAVKDPSVSPPANAFVGPVGVVQQAGPLAGVRLQAAGQPREVRVPRLHVDSEVVPISGQSGTLLPPSDPQVLGWWREGKWAGAGYGSAVVTGHTVHTGGGALDHLGELVVGDSVRVRTDAGWIRYVVQRTRVYSKAELARDADQVFRLDGPGRLVLITCDNWNGSFYESNAVVYAAPVADQPDQPDGGTQVPDPGPAS